MHIDRMRIPALLLLALLPGTGGRADGSAFSEEFSAAGNALPAGWVTINRSSPAGEFGWYKGRMFTDLESRSGGTDFAGVNWESAGPGGGATASAWLISPPITFDAGQTLSFASRAFDTGFPDRLQVRLSVTGTSTDVGPNARSAGDFSRLLLDVNPGYATHPEPGAFPVAWTAFSVPIRDLGGPTTGRLAFRYFVEDAGPDGTRGGEIALDDVTVTVAPEPTSACGVIAAVAAVLAGRRPRKRG